MAWRRPECTQGLYNCHCPSCVKAHGHQRKYRRLTPEAVGEGTLNTDLSGSHPPDIATSWLQTEVTKQTEEVAKALISVICQIASLAQGVSAVFRIQNDAGKELEGRGL